jgi:hypothetical protein
MAILMGWRLGPGSGIRRQRRARSQGDDLARKRRSCRGRGAASSLLLVTAALSGCSFAARGDGSAAVAAAAVRAARLVYSHASIYVVQRQPPKDSCHAQGRGLFVLPDPRCTPGALNAAVNQGDIYRTICREGWTETVRPPEAITEAEKRASMQAYGDTGPLHAYEYDHLVPLELGGAPNDPRNLWPEPGTSPNPKDHVEWALNRLVCEGRVPLARAQEEIATNWIKLYREGVRER